MRRGSSPSGQRWSGGESAPSATTRRRRGTCRPSRGTRRGGARAIRSRMPAPISQSAHPGRSATGDHYVVNGTKTWTTLAQWADMMFLPRAHGPGSQAARGDLLPADRHARLRGRGQADHHHRWRAGDQHRLPHRREGAGRGPYRRGEQGLDVCQVPAGTRALRHRTPRGVQGPPVVAEGHRTQPPGGRGAAGRGRRLHALGGRDRDRADRARIHRVARPDGRGAGQVAGGWRRTCSRSAAPRCSRRSPGC